MNQQKTSQVMVLQTYFMVCSLFLDYKGNKNIHYWQSSAIYNHPLFVIRYSRSITIIHSKKYISVRYTNHQIINPYKFPQEKNNFLFFNFILIHITSKLFNNTIDHRCLILTGPWFIETEVWMAPNDCFITFVKTLKDWGGK